MINKITLSKSMSDILAGQPETGMGFQDVEITLTDGRKVEGLVLNCEHLETVLPVEEKDIASIKVKTGDEVGRWD